MAAAQIPPSYPTEAEIRGRVEAKLAGVTCRVLVDREDQGEGPGYELPHGRVWDGTSQP